MTNITKKSFLNFFLSNKIYFVTFFSSIFLFLSGVWQYSYIISIIIFVTFFVFANKQEILSVFLFLLFFSGIKVFFIITASCAFLIYAAKYIIDVIKKRNKVYKTPLLLTFLIIVIFLIVGLCYQSFGFSAVEQGCMIIVVLLFIYLMFCTYKEISVTKCMDFLFLGLVVSVLYGLFSLLIPNYSIVVFADDGTYKRARFFAYHVNQLSMLCLFLISFSVYQISEKRGRLVQNILAIILSVVIGLLTLSKAFILVLAIIALYSIILLIKKFKLKSLWIICPLVVVGLILCLIFHGFIEDIFSRFLAYGDSESLLSSITTGRTEIWKMYLELSVSSVWRFLFGIGLFSNEPISKGPHSVWIYILNRFGLIGIILLILLAVSYIKNMESKFKPKLSNFLPFLTFLLLSLEEMVLSERFMVLVAFSIIIMLEKPNNENLNSEDSSNEAHKNIEEQ